MLKRFLYIFALCCFVNSAFGCVPGGYCSDTSLLDLLIGQFQGDDDDGGGESVNKDVCGHHLAVARKMAVARRMPQILSAIGQILFPVPRVYANYLIRKPILPSYYNFLFRLSPF